MFAWTEFRTIYRNEITHEMKEKTLREIKVKIYTEKHKHTRNLIRNSVDTYANISE